MWPLWIVSSSLALSFVACLGALWSLLRVRASRSAKLALAVNELETRMECLESAHRVLETEWTSHYDKMRKMNARLRARWDAEATLPETSFSPNPDGGVPAAPGAPVSTKHLRQKILSDWTSRMGRPR